ncbi:MAG: hypothetical protein KBA26_11820 [Candidatus Delongbacteria bacterium]|nr:hypothetical protein [Candidatus Delongbacteria bacterium]
MKPAIAVGVVLVWIMVIQAADSLERIHHRRLPVFSGRMELDEYQNPVLFDLRNNEIVLVSNDFLHHESKQVFMYETQSVRFYAKSSSYSSSVGLLFYSPFRKSYLLTDYEIDFIADQFQLSPNIEPERIFFFEPSSLYVFSASNATLYYYPNFLTSRQIVKPLTIPRYHTIVGSTDQHELIILDKKNCQFYFFSIASQSVTEELPEGIMPCRMVVSENRIYALPEIGVHLYIGIVDPSHKMIWNKCRLTGSEDHWSDLAVDKKMVFTLSANGELSRWAIRGE